MRKRLDGRFVDVAVFSAFLILLFVSVVYGSIGSLNLMKQILQEEGKDSVASSLPDDDVAAAFLKFRTTLGSEGVKKLFEKLDMENDLEAFTKDLTSDDISFISDSAKADGFDKARYHDFLEESVRAKMKRDNPKLETANFEFKLEKLGEGKLEYVKDAEGNGQLVLKGSGDGSDIKIPVKELSRFNSMEVLEGGKVKLGVAESGEGDKKTGGGSVVLEPGQNVVSAFGDDGLGTKVKISGYKPYGDKDYDIEFDLGEKKAGKVEPVIKEDGKFKGYKMSPEVKTAEIYEGKEKVKSFSRDFAALGFKPQVGQNTPTLNPGKESEFYMVSGTGEDKRTGILGSNVAFYDNKNGIYAGSMEEFLVVDGDIEKGDVLVPGMEKKQVGLVHDVDTTQGKKNLIKFKTDGLEKGVFVFPGAGETKWSRVGTDQAGRAEYPDLPGTGLIFNGEGVNDPRSIPGTNAGIGDTPNVGNNGLGGNGGSSQNQEEGGSMLQQILQMFMQFLEKLAGLAQQQQGQQDQGQQQDVKKGGEIPDNLDTSPKCVVNGDGGYDNETCPDGNCANCQNQVFDSEVQNNPVGNEEGGGDEIVLAGE